jgi:arsenical pump membrane protein
MPEALILVLLMIATVFLVVMDRRTSFEKELRQRYGFDREYWIPVISLGLAFLFSLVSFSAFRTAFIEKFEVILLILSFGVMSAGLGKSGFFRYIAYRVVERCRGDTLKLVLGMFLVTSAVTFFTTNDIVILLLTPIIIEIAFQADLENAKLILLAQFIAANTLSMGLLIGSPTNIIVADTLQISFFQYLSIMTVPAAISMTSSLLLLYLTVKISRKSSLTFFSGLEVRESYEVPKENPETEFTSQMRDWLLIFGFFIATVALITYLHVSLTYSAVTAILVSLTYWKLSSKHTEGLAEPVKHLPYGIVFFGMTFFTFAEQFSRTGLFTEKIIPMIQNLAETPYAALGTLYGSGLMVNTFNDLPSSALIAQTLPKLQLEQTTQIVMTQASLVGLNLGTYVTPVGALAGLIWFNRIREQVRKEKTDSSKNIEVPKRTDLVKYGILHFLFTGLMTGLFLTLKLIAL